MRNLTVETMHYDGLCGVDLDTLAIATVHGNHHDHHDHHDL